jgi:hypothetical protein
LFSNIAPCCAACTFVLFAIVYHIECASTYYTIKKSGFKESRNRDIKVSLLGQGLVLVGFVWLFANFGSQKKRYRIIPITTPTEKNSIYITNGLGLRIY